MPSANNAPRRSNSETNGVPHKGKIAKGAMFNDFFDIKPVFTLTGATKADVPEIRSFETAQLDQRLVENIQRLGYERPTPIQMQGIPLVAAGFDMMGCAVTGSVKTIVLDNIRFLVLDEADRMLDMGFEQDMRRLVAHESMPIIGKRQTLMLSATFPDPIQKLAHDFLNRDHMGFIQVGEIGSANPCIKQKFENVTDLLEHGGKRNKLVEILSCNKENVEGKDITIHKQKTIVFAETRKAVEEIFFHLLSENLSVTSYHGGTPQKRRVRALRDFQNGIYAILVVNTGVGSRGLDIPYVDHVINYDLPVSTVQGGGIVVSSDVEVRLGKKYTATTLVVRRKKCREASENRAIADYVQRIGRTGRAGNSGRSTSFYESGRDKDLAKHLVKILAGVQQEIPEYILNDAGMSGKVTGYGGRTSGERADGWD